MVPWRDVYKRQVGDVGKAGVAVDSILDMEILFKGIPPVSYTHLDVYKRQCGYPVPVGSCG